MVFLYPHFWQHQGFGILKREIKYQNSFCYPKDINKKKDNQNKHYFKNKFFFFFFLITEL